jgi:hypothetical protein
LSENDKALSERISACQKQQTLVGNDKRLSEKTKLSRQIYPYLRKAFVENVSQTYLPCQKKQAHACWSLSFFRGTYLPKRNVD